MYANASTFFDKQNGGKGRLAQRFDRMMGPDAVRSGIGTHVDQIEGRQGALEEAMKVYRENGCGGPGAPQHTPINAEAYTNMGRTPPTVEDWEAEHGRPMPEGDYQPGGAQRLESMRDTGILNNPESSGIMDWEYWEEVTGLTGAALAVYLIVSEGSRLFPPRNAIPIP